MGEIQINKNKNCITKHNFKFVRLKATIFESWGCIYFVNSRKIEALYEHGVTAKQIGEALNPRRDRRTIERELQMGMVEQKQLNPSFKKYEPLHIIKKTYKVYSAQMRHNERASNKLRGLKIENDQKLANYIDSKIKDEKWSPNVIIGRIKIEGMQFNTSICTKTVYNYIYKGIFREVTNKDLWVKKNGSKKRDYKKIRKVALNNKNGKSISKRSKEADERSEQGHWEIDLVIGKQGTKPAILTLVEQKTQKSLCE